MDGLMMNIPLTTNYILEFANRVFPNKYIVSKLPDGNTHKYSYHEMYKRTMKLANALKNKLGIKPGQRVATFAWNNYQHLELYYAIPAIGSVCHPLNLRLSVEQIAYIVNHAEDEVVFIDHTLLPLFEKVAVHTKMVKHYVLLNAPDFVETTLPSYIQYEDLLKGESDQFEYEETSEDTAIGMCYTSGTTGFPKGVLYSNRSTYLHALALNSGNATGITMNDTVLLIVPQFHVMAWGFPFCCFIAGANLVMPGPHLNALSLINIIKDEDVSIANGVPTIWHGIYNELVTNPVDLPSFKTLLVGGSAFPKSLVKGFEEKIKINVIHAWGMTETSPLGTLSRKQTHHQYLSADEQYEIQAKQGVEMFGVEIRTVSENGEINPRDGKTVGEIEVRGNWVIGAYYKVESNNFTTDGWFKTGDVGTIDPEGYMEITDRTKDLIKSGGEWISSVALENTLLAHNSIKEVAVIAIPDEKWDERPLAVVILEESMELDNNILNQHLLDHSFAKFQLPDKYVLVKAIPKTSVGKIDKKTIRKMFKEGGLNS